MNLKKINNKDYIIMTLLKTGVLEYPNKYDYNTKEIIFNKKTMDSFIGKPLLKNHPKDFNKFEDSEVLGKIKKVFQEGDNLKAYVELFDKNDFINEYKEKKGSSAGYLRNKKEKYLIADHITMTDEPRNKYFKAFDSFAVDKKIGGEMTNEDLLKTISDFFIEKSLDNAMLDELLIKLGLKEEEVSEDSEETDKIDSLEKKLDEKVAYLDEKFSIIEDMIKNLSEKIESVSSMDSKSVDKKRYRAKEEIRSMDSKGVQSIYQTETKNNNEKIFKNISHINGYGE